MDKKLISFANNFSEDLALSIISKNQRLIPIILMSILKNYNYSITQHREARECILNFFENQT